MGRISRLTDMQKKFVEFLVYGDPKSGEPLNQTEAAKLAGYAPQNPHAWKVLNYVIQNYHHWLLPTKDN